MIPLYPVSFRVVGGGGGVLDVEDLHGVLEQLAHELHPVVGVYHLWHAMHVYITFQQGVGHHRCGNISQRDGGQESGKTIQNGKDV